MLPSRDSGCKGTTFIWYPQILSYFIGFFSISFKNQPLIGCDLPLLPAFRRH